MISTAEAPSEICDDVPAVCRPSSSTGFSPARPSSVVSRRPWSLSTTWVSPVGPSSPMTGALSGAISRVNRPSSHGDPRLLLGGQPERVEVARGSGRGCGRSGPRRRTGRACRSSSRPGAGEPRPGGTLPPSGIRLIDSMPQAMPTSMDPAATRSLTRWADCWPEPHWASMVVAPVRWASPALQPGPPDHVVGLLAGLGDAAADDLVDLAESRPERSSSWVRACPSRLAGWTPASQPRRLPRGVRTASMMTGVPMERK